MDDSLKTLDLSAEGTISVPAPSPVVPTPPAAPLGASTPPPTPQPTVVTQSNGPTDKKPMGKKTKIVAGVLSVLVLLSGLGVGLFLARQKQNVVPKAFSPGNCRCSGTSWVCENEQGGTDYIREEPSCTTGAPPSSEEVKVTDPNTGITTTTSQTTTFTNPTTGNTTTQTFTGATTAGPTVVTTVNTTGNSTGGVPVTDGAGGVKVNNRTGACGQCGGLNQGGCDNNPTSYTSGGVTTTGPGCGFGCLGGLHFCTNSGSCQASCPAGYEAAGPLDSNADIKNCLLTGKCDGKNAAGFTQASLIAASGNTNLTGTNNKIVYDGGGLTVAQCNTGGVDYWCMGIPEAPASQPLLKNGFCGKAGIGAGKTCNDQFKANFGFNVTYGCKDATGAYKESGCGYGSGTFTTQWGNVTWTWDMYKGFTISNPGALIARRYYCDNLFSLSSTTGCTCENPTPHCQIFKGTEALAFNQNLCGVQQIDLDTGTGAHVSRNIVNSNCGGTTTTTTTTLTGGGNPPGGGSNPTPTPTTNNPSYACYQLAIMRNGNQISASNVQVGDNLLIRGFATASNTTVSKIRFVVSINGVAQAPVDVNASLISGMYQADMPYTITQAASYAVTASPISP